MTIRIVVAVAVVVVLAAVAWWLERRRRRDAPLQGRLVAPAQLDRHDFASPEVPWLVVLFTSEACESCQGLYDKAAPLASADVAVVELEYPAARAMHDRYQIAAAPMTLVADGEGVVRASFLGVFSASELWNAVAELRGVLIAKEHRVMAALEHVKANADPDEIYAVLDRDGGVIIDDLLTPDVVARVNDEVEAAVDAADPEQEYFNPVMSEFHGRFTKQVAGVPGISRTFATEVMCNPVLLAMCDRVLLPSCATYQLNLGHLLQRGPGSGEQWLHRDEAVWSDVPIPHPELQLASVIAFVDFTREGGATRVVPGSHCWPDRQLTPAEQITGPQPDPEQIAYAEMSAGSAVVYLGGTLHAGGANSTEIARRAVHLSYCLGWLRTEENNILSTPLETAAALPRRAQELLGYGIHDSLRRGGGYLGMVRMQDPVELLARGEL